MLVSKLLNINSTDFSKTFDIVIQLGAILAVVVLYFKKFFDMELIKKLIIAFIPTGIVGVFLYPFIKNYLLGNSAVTLNALFWGGIALILIEFMFSKKKNKEGENNIDYTKISYKKAFAIGSFQCLSMIPGVSRAAATIIGGVTCGLNRSTATEFSFLLAVPTMIMASGYDLYKSRELISQGGFLTLAVGTILSFVFAMLAIKFLIGFFKKHDFKIFGVYRIILAVLFWIFIR